MQTRVILLLVLWAGAVNAEELYSGKEVCEDISHIMNADSQYCIALPTIEDCQIIKDEDLADLIRNNPKTSIQWLSDRRWKKYMKKQRKVIKTARPRELAKLYLDSMICDRWEEEGHWKYKASAWVLELNE